MGGGSWTAATYDAVTKDKILRGATFGYHDTVRKTGNYAAHENLDPSKKNSQGVNVRESRDSDEHPRSIPIIVGFDSTGSMSDVPRKVQKSLPTLFPLLSKYVDDTQIAISTYGDATCEQGSFAVLSI